MEPRCGRAARRGARGVEADGGNGGGSSKGEHDYVDLARRVYVCAGGMGRGRALLCAFFIDHNSYHIKLQKVEKVGKIARISSNKIS